MKSKSLKYLIATIISGLSMWIVAGLWHNMVLPLIDKNVEAHHEGIEIMLIAYLILAFLMVYLFGMIPQKHKYIFEGLRIGIVVGIIWVFPHGLAMAGAHNTSIFYEIRNAIWHMIEQGFGGIIIAMIFLKIHKNWELTIYENA